MGVVVDCWLLFCCLLFVTLVLLIDLCWVAVAFGIAAVCMLLVLDFLDVCCW